LVRLKINNITIVVLRNLCTKCGICYSACPLSAISITGYIDKKPVVNNLCNNCGLCLKVCPGIAPVSSPDDHSLLGFTRSCHLGYSTDEMIRRTSSSGGLMTSLCTTMLTDYNIDGVICTRQKPSDIFDNEIILARNEDDLLSARGSRYAPVYVCRGIKDLGLKEGGTYVFVGKPCDIQALMKYQRVVKKYNFFKIAIFCAHTPLMSATKEIIDQSGINLKDISRLQYRGDGWPGYFTLHSLDNQILFRRDYMTVWSTILCKRKNRNRRCLLCHDCTGEMADISLGDAWLKELIGNSPGHSIAIARSEEAEKLLEVAKRKKRIQVEKIDPEKVISSQKSLLEKKKNVYFRRMINKLLLEEVPEETVPYKRSMNNLKDLPGIIKLFTLMKFRL